MVSRLALPTDIPGINQIRADFLATRGLTLGDWHISDHKLGLMMTHANSSLFIDPPDKLCRVVTHRTDASGAPETHEAAWLFPVAAWERDNLLALALLLVTTLQHRLANVEPAARSWPVWAQFPYAKDPITQQHDGGRGACEAWRDRVFTGASVSQLGSGVWRIEWRLDLAATVIP